MKTLLLLASLATLPAHAETALEHNKRIVREFYDLAFNQHHYEDAALKYLREDYKQHNPHVADGRKGFLDAFAGQTGPDESVTLFKRFIAEDDLVMVHSHGIDHPSDPKDLGVAVVDIFRVEGDLITEHWDVGQKVPEKSANSNGMF